MQKIRNADTTIDRYRRPQRLFRSMLSNLQSNIHTQSIICCAVDCGSDNNLVWPLIVCRLRLDMANPNDMPIRVRSTKCRQFEVHGHTCIPTITGSLSVSEAMSKYKRIPALKESDEVDIIGILGFVHWNLSDFTCFL